MAGILRELKVQNIKNRYEAEEQASHQNFDVRQLSAFNSMWIRYALGHHTSWSALVQVKAWCHFGAKPLSEQCWLVIKGVLWHSPESDFTRSAHKFSPQHVSGDYNFKITTASPRGQWGYVFHSIVLHIYPICHDPTHLHRAAKCYWISVFCYWNYTVVTEIFMKFWPKYWNLL